MIKYHLPFARLSGMILALPLKQKKKQGGSINQIHGRRTTSSLTIVIYHANTLAKSPRRCRDTPLHRPHSVPQQHSTSPRTRRWRPRPCTEDGPWAFTACRDMSAIGVARRLLDVRHRFPTFFTRLLLRRTDCLSALLHLADNLGGPRETLHHLLALLASPKGVVALFEEIIQLVGTVHVFKKFTLHLVFCKPIGNSS